MDEKKIPATIPVDHAVPPPPFLGRRQGGTGIVMSNGHEATREELAAIVAEVDVRKRVEDQGL